MKTRFITSITIAALLLGACGNISTSDQPGNGTWRDSDIQGSVTETETIRLQDDFAAAANQKFAANASIGDGSFQEAYKTLLKRKRQLLKQLPDDGEAGVLKKYAASAADWEQRKKDGVEPLRNYIEIVENISSLDDLTAFECDKNKNPLCLGVLMPTSCAQSQTDPTVNALTVGMPELTLGSDGEYSSITETGLEQRDYVNQITERILGKLGFENERIQNILKANYRFERKLAACEMLLTKKEMEGMLMNRSDCIAAAPGYPLEKILDAWEAPADGSYYINTETVQKLLPLYSERNLEDIKCMLIVKLVLKAARNLDRETYDYDNKLREGRLNEPKAESPFPEEEREGAVLFNEYLSNSACGPILDRLYVQKYVDDAMVDDLSQLTTDIIAEFRTLFSDETWLSEEGRTLCLEKLDALKIHVAIPNFELQDWSDLQVDENKSFFDNMLASQCCLMEQNFQACALPYDREKWDPIATSTTGINAYYMSTTNGIYILAGILTDPICPKSKSWRVLARSSGMRLPTASTKTEPNTTNTGSKTIGCLSRTS